MYVYNILPKLIDVTTIPKSMEGDTVKYENDKIDPLRCIWELAEREDNERQLMWNC